MKKLLSSAGVALLALTIGVVGCDDDTAVTPVAPTPTAPIFGTVSGTVSVEGSGLAGVSVNLSGAASQSASTGSSGGYSFDNVPAGTHSVQISGAPDEVTFASTTTVVTIATSGQTAAADFSGTYIRTSIIEGSVTAGGEGVVATVTATGAEILMSEQAVVGSSDTDGDFELTGLRAGTYHVEISQFPEGIEFPVTMRDVTVGVGLSANVSFDAPGEDGPTTGTGGSLIITGVTDDDGDNEKISGYVTARIDVERGEFEKIALYVDGAEVDAQLFGLGPAPAAEPPLAAQEGVVFSLSFNSAEYDPDTGEVKYPNGAHEIVAGVTVQGSTEEAYSNRMEVEFKNSSVVVASVNGLGDGARNSSTGQVWHGGPDVSVEISALAVSYSSGAAVSSVTLLPFCDDDAATDTEAPFSFPVDCDGFQSESVGTTPMFNVDGAVIDSEGGKVYLDFKAPDAPHFNVDPNEREDGWVNPTVDFLGEFKKDKNDDGWLFYNEDEEGVGGYAPQLRFSSTTPSIVDGAREATPNALPTAPTKKDAACVIATAVDLLGNESKLPSAGSACVAAAKYVEREDGDYPGGLRAGLDVTAPTIEFSPASPKEDASSLKEFQLQVADPGGSTGKSGLHSNPVLSKVEARDADNDVLCGDDKDLGVGGGGSESLTGECKLAAVDDDGNYIGVEFNDPLATTSGLADADVDGYYTFTAVAQDKAGNRSEEVVRTAANDGADPELGLIVGGYDKGSWSVTATLTDNLSIKQYWAEATENITLEGGAGDLIILPREGSVTVDEYNSPDLTQSHLTTLTMQVYRALQAAGPSDAPAAIDAIRVVGTDHGGRDNSEEALAAVLGSTATLATLDRFGRRETAAQQEQGEGADAAERWNDNEDASGVDILYARDEVFQDFAVKDDEDDGDVLELRASITGTAAYAEAVAGVADDQDTDVDEEVEEVRGQEGLVNNPASRVDFYAAVILKPSGTGDEANPNDVPPAPDGAGDEALVFLGSANAAGAEDFMCNSGTRAPSTDPTAVTCRQYVWGLDMSGADFVEIAGDEGTIYEVVAFAVNSDGVAISAVSDQFKVEE